MSELFGTQYFGFIASSFGVTLIVLLGMTIWILMTYRARHKALAKLEAAGIKRANKT